MPFLSPDQQLAYANQQFAQHHPTLSAGEAVGTGISASVANLGPASLAVGGILGMTTTRIGDPFERGINYWRSTNAQARQAAGRAPVGMARRLGGAGLRMAGMGLAVPIAMGMTAHAASGQLLEGQREFMAARQLAAQLPETGFGSQSILTPGSQNFSGDQAEVQSLLNEVRSIASATGSSTAQVRNTLGTFSQVPGALDTRTARSTSQSFRKMVRDLKEISELIQVDLEEAFGTYTQLQQMGISSRSGRRSTLRQLGSAASLTGQSFGQVANTAFGAAATADAMGYNPHVGFNMGLRNLTSAAMRMDRGDIDAAYMRRVGGIDGYVHRMTELELGLSGSQGGVAYLSRMFNSDGSIRQEGFDQVMSGGQDPSRVNFSRLREMDPYKLAEMQEQLQRFAPSMIQSRIANIRQQHADDPVRANREQYRLLSQMGISDAREQLEFLQHIDEQPRASLMTAAQGVADRGNLASARESSFERVSFGQRVSDEVRTFFRTLTGNIGEELERAGQAMAIKSRRMGEQIINALDGPARDYGDFTLDAGYVSQFRDEILSGDYRSLSSSYIQSQAIDQLRGVRGGISSLQSISGVRPRLLEDQGVGGVFGDGAIGRGMNQMAMSAVYGLGSLSRRPIHRRALEATGIVDRADAGGGVGRSPYGSLARGTAWMVPTTADADTGIRVAEGRYATEEEFLRMVALDQGGLLDENLNPIDIDAADISRLGEGNLREMERMMSATSEQVRHRSEAGQTRSWGDSAANIMGGLAVGGAAAWLTAGAVGTAAVLSAPAIAVAGAGLAAGAAGMWATHHVRGAIRGYADSEDVGSVGTLSDTDRDRLRQPANKAAVFDSVSQELWDRNFAELSSDQQALVIRALQERGGEVGAVVTEGLRGGDANLAIAGSMELVQQALVREMDPYKLVEMDMVNDTAMMSDLLDLALLERGALSEGDLSARARDLQDLGLTRQQQQTVKHIGRRETSDLVRSREAIREAREVQQRSLFRAVREEQASTALTEIRAREDQRLRRALAPFGAGRGDDLYSGFDRDSARTEQQRLIERRNAGTLTRGEQQQLADLELALALDTGTSTSALDTIRSLSESLVQSDGQIDTVLATTLQDAGFDTQAVVRLNALRGRSSREGLVRFLGEGEGNLNLSRDHMLHFLGLPDDYEGRDESELRRDMADRLRGGGSEVMGRLAQALIQAPPELEQAGKERQEREADRTLFRDVMRRLGEAARGESGVAISVRDVTE